MKFWMSLLCCTVLMAVGRAVGLDLYVAVGGNDGWTGRQPQAGESSQGPFATLERARDEIRKLRAAGRLQDEPVTVHIREGVYALESPFELSPADSGTAESPVIYRAYAEERPRVIGGREISNLVPVTDESILGRLDPVARGHVVQADLNALGISDFGTVVPGGKRFELFYDQRPMTLARWPNDGYTRVGKLLGDKETEFISHGQVGNKIGKFTYEGDRPARWTQEPEIWLSGYWFYDWSDAFDLVESIDTDQRVIALKYREQRLGYRSGQRYYAVNLLSEIDLPGEWYLDRGTGTLYFWPPPAETESRTFASVLEDLIVVRDASHIVLRCLTLEHSRNTAVTIQNGSNVQLKGCTLRNIGGRAVRIEGGREHAVIGCDFYDTGEGGVVADGGDRERLVPGSHLVVNNHFYRYSRNRRTYRPAISVNGVGHRVAHNLIHDAPHLAIQFTGNDHLIELNEIYHVCTETDDAGAIYTGRNWTWRGNRIRHNYFHHMGDYKTLVGVQTVYLDDLVGGTVVYGNVFYKGGRGVLIGGGRHNLVENNVFVDCTPAVHVDSRGTGWAKAHLEDPKNPLYTTLAKTPYKTPPWSTRYPELLDLLEDEPARAKYNIIRRNICVGGKWLELHDGLDEQTVTVQENWVDRDPGFVDAVRQDFRLREDSPVFKLGFEPIPFEKIGLYQDEFRASWPPPPRPDISADGL